MITTITADNKTQYLQYFQELTQLLSTHTEDGSSCEQFSTDAILQPTYIGTIDADEFEENYYVKIENGKYESSFASTYEDGAEYGIIEINSLDQVYNFMRNLVQVESWKKYTRLPLDEPYFTIDANTRVITVPNDFKNGVAVQGDESSEILYFKINRYVDMTDLADSNVEIYIQWENANKKTGNSIPYIIDIESEPGYLIFGWPLSSEITAKAGTITFAVRFFTYDDMNPISYSLATQNQTIKILSSLDFSMDSTTEANAINKNEVIKNRLINSSIRSSNNISTATDPIFFSNLNLDYYKNSEDVYLMNGIADELAVEAYSTDAGKISYAWVKYNLSEDNTSSSNISSVSYKTDMVKTEDTTVVENKIYYVNASDDNIPAWTIITGDNLTEALTDENIDVYEKQSIGTIDGPGCYSVKAINRLSTSTGSTNSPIFDTLDEDYSELDRFLIVPHPSSGSIEDMDSVSYQLSDSAIMLNAGKSSWGKFKGPESYVWQYSKDNSNEESYSNISDENNSTISLLGSFKEVQTSRLTLKPADVLKVGSNYWKDSNGEAGALEQVSEEEIENGTIIDGLKYYVEVSTDAYSYNVPDLENNWPVSDGYYRVKAINSLNTEQAETEFSTPVRAYYPIVRPNCIIKLNGTEITDGKSLTVGTTLTAEASLPEGAIYTDGDINYTYTWYKYNTYRSAIDQFNGTLPSCVARWMAKNGTFEPDPDEEIGMGENYVIQASDAGSYIYCVATAKYYNSEATSVATPFALVISG